MGFSFESLVFFKRCQKSLFHGMLGVVQYFVFISASYILIFEKIRQIEIIHRNRIYGKSIKAHTTDYTGPLLII